MELLVAAGMLLTPLALVRHTQIARPVVPTRVVGVKVHQLVWMVSFKEMHSWMVDLKHKMVREVVMFQHQQRYCLSGVFFLSLFCLKGKCPPAGLWLVSSTKSQKKNECKKRNKEKGENIGPKKKNSVVSQQNLQAGANSMSQFSMSCAQLAESVWLEKMVTVQNKGIESQRRPNCWGSRVVVHISLLSNPIFNFFFSLFNLNWLKCLDNNL